MDNDFLKNLDLSQVRELVESMYSQDYALGSYLIREGEVGKSGHYELFISLAKIFILNVADSNKCINSTNYDWWNIVLVSLVQYFVQTNQCMYRFLLNMFDFVCFVPMFSYYDIPPIAEISCLYKTVFGHNA